MFLGTTTLVGEMSVDAVNLAIDGKGNFYSTLYNGNTLYTYTAQTYRTPSVWAPPQLCLQGCQLHGLGPQYR